MAEPVLKESEWCPVPLDDSEARELVELGRRLSAGSLGVGDVASDDGPSPAVIECQKRVDGAWYVRVRECVGAVGVGTRTLVVAPKVPLEHLSWLMSVAGFLPRMDSQTAPLAAGQDLWQLLARWYIGAAETVVRKDLVKGYESVHAELGYLRGTPQVLPMTRTFLRGRLAAPSRFEDFTPDNALNRVLKEALRGLLASQRLEAAQARRVRRLLSNFHDVGSLQPDDLRVQAERHTSHYRVPLGLAKELIRHTYRELHAGTSAGWAFLVRTPDVVEAAVRSLLARHLRASVVVSKTTVTGAGLSFNPDLVFGSVSVGDVKYSIDEHAWRRSDVYQALAFAAVFKVHSALLINFALVDEHVRRAEAEAGGVRLQRLSWPCGTAPATAADRLCEATEEWFHTQLLHAPQSTRLA